MSNLEYSIYGIKTNNELKRFIDRNQKNMDKLDWIAVTKLQSFSRNIIEKYGDKLPWDHLCIFYKVPLDLLEKHMDQLEWYAVSVFQNIDEVFIEKFKDYLSLDKIHMNLSIPDSVKLYAKKVMNENSDAKHHKRWDYNFKNSIFSPKNFSRKYTDYTDKTKMSGNGKITFEKKKVQGTNNYDTMSKAQLKEILKSRGVRTLYHDTLDILKQKCIASEV